MKKFFKSLTMICFALLLVLPLALVGCGRNYTIDIKIKEGEGFVYLKAVNGDPIIGKNAVDKGDKFEYFIKPNNGYEISKIEIDGEEYDKSYQKTGAYLFFDNVKANHVVEVSFVITQRTVEFYCWSDTLGDYELYNSIDVNYGSIVDLNQDSYGGEDNVLWFVEDTTSGSVTYKYLYNGSDDPTDSVPANFESNKIYVRANWKVFTTKTSAELDSILDANA